jgi:hypothetical protein
MLQIIMMISIPGLLLLGYLMLQDLYLMLKNLTHRILNKLFPKKER